MAPWKDKKVALRKASMKFTKYISRSAAIGTSRLPICDTNILQKDLKILCTLFSDNVDL